MKKEEYCRQVGVAIWTAVLDSKKVPRDVAKATRIPMRKFDAWLRGERLPTLQMWGRLESVLGRINLPKDVPPPSPERKAASGVPCRGLLKAMRRAGKWPTSVGREIGVSRQVIYKWDKLGMMPTARAVQVAAILGCAVEDLNGEK